MVGFRRNFVDLSNKIIEESKADEVEIRVIQSDNALTRYANSRIHQNLSKKKTGVSIRAVIGNKVGYSSTNSLEEESVKDCLKRAEALAKIQNGGTEPIRLPGPEENDEKTENYVKKTEDTTPEERADKVKEITEIAADNEVDRVFGALRTETQRLFVANSNGVERSSEFTSSNLTTTAIVDWKNDRGFGWSESCSDDIEDIDHRKVGRRAIKKGLDNLDPQKVQPGAYDVVLEPLAVKSLLEKMDMMGFSGKKVQEERSFLNGKFGDRIMDERVNIYDDVFATDTIGHSFDYEGAPKERVDIIKNGVANEVVYDSYTASNEKEKYSTGHALPLPDSESPLAMNLLMDTGKSSLKEMIEETQRGILVTRFNYCIPVHSGKGILTGLTRDGTWLIENGEIKHPVKNLRFTQNLVEAFDNIKSIGGERRLFSTETYLAYFTVPALSISDFNFTGTTEF